MFHRLSFAALAALAFFASLPAELFAQAATPAAAPPPPPYAPFLKDAPPIPGILTLYRRGNSLFVELGPQDYGSEYIVLISISRGIAQDPLIGGMSWGFGDDWIWQFRKVDENVHIIRRNVRFKANQGSPEARAVSKAYTDSVLFSLPIASKGPKGGDLIDLSRVFMSDLPQISMALPGFGFAGDRSTFGAVKGFDNNVEIEVAATYASAGTQDIDTVPDSRGVGINVHYSISKIPQTNYQPRLADDRVGYFLTAVKDFSSKGDREQFVRYVNRWDLQKSDPTAKVSPPVKPIKFWIEKTVPFKYEKAIYDGIYEWNKAFEAAGFANAIVVERQPDSATWDPEDINYNTFRWITSNAGFAMGPSRVNPYTGQILDADIIFDADFLTSWKEEFENLTPKTISQLPQTGRSLRELLLTPVGHAHGSCQLARGMSMQMAFGSAAVAAAEIDPKLRGEQLEKFIVQGLREVTMHEVGHTLGLRHNFKASKWLTLKDMNDPAKAKEGIVASVMDYSPANIVAKGQVQGDYYSQTIGPYDIWAIQYGYTPFAGGTAGEIGDLKKIASRSGEPQLAYATDEDTRPNILNQTIDPDPDTNRFDMGADTLEFARSRSQIVGELIPGLVERVTLEGEDYTQARRVFSILLHQRGEAMYFASRYIGGLKTSRSHRGDKDARPLATAVDAKTQRDALALIDENVLSEKAFQFPPELYSQLGWTNWQHWGIDPRAKQRKDFAVHDVALRWQERVIDQVLSPITLERMHDAELKVAPDADVLTTAELIERLTKSVFSEVENIKEGDYTARKPAINSLRRNLQRTYLKSLSHLAMGNTGAPEDCKTIAYDQLSRLSQRMNALLQNGAVAAKLDPYSRAHLQESKDRIQKVLEAKLTLNSP
jgi:Met-zincin/Domain of unknown function (DUF5117)